MIKNERCLTGGVCLFSEVSVDFAGWHSIKGRCLLDADHVRGLGVSVEHFCHVVREHLGFERLQVDLDAEARALVGTGVFERRTKLVNAPTKVDCSSLVWDLYRLMGVKLPRLAIDQRSAGKLVPV